MRLQKKNSLEYSGYEIQNNIKLLKWRNNTCRYDSIFSYIVLLLVKN